jgi:uncharacterized short protein YbdD (DUF466 family)
MEQAMNWFRQCWQRIRQLSGDDVYERYLAHYAEHHDYEADGAPPLSRAEFFKQWQDQKWQGIKRCC